MNSSSFCRIREQKGSCRDAVRPLVPDRFRRLPRAVSHPPGGLSIAFHIPDQMVAAFRRIQLDLEASSAQLL
jgi:hypothetical protein